MAERSGLEELANKFDDVARQSEDAWNCMGAKKECCYRARSRGGDKVFEGRFEQEACTHNKGNRLVIR